MDFFGTKADKKASGLFSDGRKFAKRGQLGVPKSSKTAKRSIGEKGQPKDEKKGVEGVPQEGRHGLWTFWFENGKKLSEGEFVLKGDLTVR